MHGRYRSFGEVNRAPEISRSLANVLASGTMIAQPTKSSPEINKSRWGRSHKMSRKVPKANTLTQMAMARRSRRKKTLSKRAAAASASLGSPHSGQRTPAGLG